MKCGKCKYWKQNTKTKGECLLHGTFKRSFCETTCFEGKVVDTNKKIGNQAIDGKDN